MSLTTHLKDADVEVLFCEASEMCIEHKEEKPLWAIEEYNPDDDEGQIVIHYRGTLTGKFMSYFVEEDNNSEGDFFLSARIAVGMDCPLLADDPSIRYVTFPVESVAWARIVSAPVLN